VNRWEMQIGAASKAPKYFKEAGHQCPTDPKNGLIQYAFQTKLSSYEFFSTMPHIQRDFNSFMGSTMGARKYWVDWFDVQGRILNGAVNGSAMIVDVGGGKGHDLEAFHEKFLGKGRLVLQDLPQALEGIEGLGADIERMSYDFFAKQPVQGE
jgi:hypothetical protein